mgnify:CR=1 FL=1
MQLMAEQNGFRLNVPSEAKANAVLDEVAKTASEVIDKFTGELTGKENGGTGRDGTSMKIRVHAEGTFLNRYEQQYEKETVEDVRISRISKQGFAEIGETIEETVHREVMEEVGLKVKNLRYYKSQPWSFSGTLLFGFFCDVDGDDTLTVDHEELSMAQWVERDKIPDQGNNISLTKEMMMLFRDGKEPR